MRFLPRAMLGLSVVLDEIIKAQVLPRKEPLCPNERFRPFDDDTMISMGNGFLGGSMAGGRAFSSALIEEKRAVVPSFPLIWAVTLTLLWIMHAPVNSPSLISTTATYSFAATKAASFFPASSVSSGLSSAGRGQAKATIIIAEQKIEMIFWGGNFIVVLRNEVKNLTDGFRRSALGPLQVHQALAKTDLAKTRTSQRKANHPRRMKSRAISS